MTTAGRRGRRRKRGRPPTPPAVLRERARQRRAEGAQLRRRRRALGLTQEDVAQALGLHQQTVSGMERGERRVQPRVWEWVEAQGQTSVRPCPKCGAR